MTIRKKQTVRFSADSSQMCDKLLNSSAKVRRKRLFKINLELSLSFSFVSLFSFSLPSLSSFSKLFRLLILLILRDMFYFLSSILLMQSNPLFSDTARGTASSIFFFDNRLRRIQAPPFLHHNAVSRIEVM